MFDLNPLVILVIGIAVVIGMIIMLRVNAFLALISAAIVVSILAPGATADKISRVAFAFGESAGKIGIVIGMAAVIGKCMMDSGAADRIVRAFLRLLGEKRAPLALMGSGFVLAVPVFFDTVFYLLVPLARSLWQRTRKNFLLYVLAISAGGAITHTLVPPTPGPLIMAANLKFDVGVMILVGGLVALPAAFVGVIAAGVLNNWNPIPMRRIGSEPDPEPLEDHELPSLWVSLLPVILPVIMISANTVMQTLAGIEERQQAEVAAVAAAGGNAGDANAVAANAAAAQAAPPAPGQMRQIANITSLLGDANLALLLSAAIAMGTLVVQRNLPFAELSKKVEIALESGGVIILITAAGGAFGAMLKAAEIGPEIENLFRSQGGQMSGIGLLLLGFSIAAVLKVAQGSSTVAMITASAMLGAIVQSASGSLGYHPVYLATSIGSGSLVGSWMNDSGFWIFAKMSGLTEVEALKSWTILLLIMAFTALITTVILAFVMPLSAAV